MSRSTTVSVHLARPPFLELCREKEKETGMILFLGSLVPRLLCVGTRLVLGDSACKYTIVHVNEHKFYFVSNYV